jgi:hypothetical protein
MNVREEEIENLTEWARELHMVSIYKMNLFIILSFLQAECIRDVLFAQRSCT